MLRRIAQAAVALFALALFALAWHCDAAWFDRHVFWPQQFFIVASRAIIVAARAGAAAMGVLLLVLVPRLPRGTAGWRLLLALVLTLPASEILLRWRLPRLTRPEAAMGLEGLTRWTGRYGYTLAPGVDRLESSSGRSVLFRTDAEGRRISGAAIDPAAPSLIFAGESTVVGIGLQWEETFPAILGSRLHFQAVNLASPAYSAEQSWMRLRDTLPALAHPVAVVDVFMPGLIGRSFAGQRHPLPLPSPDFAGEPFPPEAPRYLHLSALYALSKHLYWSDAAVEEGVRAVALALRETAALAKARGTPCLFLVTGRTPQWMLREIFEAQGLDAVVVEVPEDELLPDGHPGPRGSLRIADALEPRLRTRIANR